MERRLGQVGEVELYVPFPTNRVERSDMHRAATVRRPCVRYGGRKPCAAGSAPAVA